MTHLYPPKPATSWTDVHKMNETLQGIVTSREEHFSKSTDQPFTILKIVASDNLTFEILCGRADLREFVDNNDPQKGDEVAIRYWGMSGTKFVYTGAIEKAGDNVKPATDWAAAPDDEHVIAYQEPTE